MDRRNCGVVVWSVSRVAAAVQFIEVRGTRSMTTVLPECVEKSRDKSPKGAYNL